MARWWTCIPNPNSWRRRPARWARIPPTCARFLKYSADLYDLVNAGYFEQGLDTAEEFRRFYGLGNFLKFDLFRTMHGGVKRYLKTRAHAGHLRLLHQVCRLVGLSLAGVHELHGHHPVPLRSLVCGRRFIPHRPRPAALDGRTRRRWSASTARSPRSASRAAGSPASWPTVTFHPADIIVSNMEVIPAYEKLLQEDDAFMRSLEKYEPSCSGLVLELGLDCQYPQLAHHNFFFSGAPARAFPHRLPQTPVAARPDDLSGRRIENRSHRGAARLRLPENPAAHSAHRR